MKCFLSLSITIVSLLISLSLSAQRIGRISGGPSMGGSGLAGATLQIRPIQNISFDFGVYGRLAHTDVRDPAWDFGLATDASLSVFLKSVNNLQKERVIFNGVYLKGGYTTGNVSDKIVGLGWAHEIHPTNHPGRFLQLQLGPSIFERTYSYVNSRYPPGHQNYSEIWTAAAIHFRLTWFFGVLN